MELLELSPYIRGHESLVIWVLSFSDMTVRRLLGKAALAAAGTAGSMLVRKVASQLKRSRVRGYQSGRARIPKQVELKAYDYNINQPFNTTGSVPAVTAINLPINGSELYQRVGRKIYMKSVHFRGWIFNNATSLPDFGRVLVIYDANPNAAAPIWTDIVADSTGGGASTVFSHLNLANRERFQILKDYQVLLPSVTNTAGVLTNYTVPDPIHHTLNVEFFIKLKGLETIYNGTNGGSIADITSGALYIVNVSSNATAKWYLNGTARLRYYD